jgi:AcrR family transcriptional regulator
MENATRSERSRNAALEAALTIIARDGPRRLTLDAIAQESGISKGGVLHHFRTKSAVLKALLQLQIDYFETFAQKYRAEADPDQAQPALVEQIAVLREYTAGRHRIGSALLGIVAEEPGLLSATRDFDLQRIESIKAEAADPDQALLRWAAARGLALMTVLGQCPLSGEETARLFDLLLDGSRWPPADATQP